MFLAGDIGGTKTVLALFSEIDGPHRPLVTTRYKSSDYISLDHLVAEFLGENQAKPSVASFGIAGPVRDRKVRVTNLPWDIDGDTLSHTLGGVPVHLINDLEAIAYAIPMLEQDDRVTIREGQRDPVGPVAIIAPGTGLGEAFLIWNGRNYQPLPSEGGHTDFAPATELELELLAYLQPRIGHVSYERVCSGIGIPNLYRFLRDCGKHEEPAWLRAELAKTKDTTPVIVQSGLEQSSEICVATLDLFVGILGSEAGNLVLQILATGGVYLGGGIPARILPKLQEMIFVDAFTRKGRFSELLSRVQVNVIVNPQAALFGAANHCFITAEMDR